MDLKSDAIPIHDASIAYNYDSTLRQHPLPKALLDLLQAPHDLGDPGLLLLIRELGVGPPAVRSLEVVPPELGHHPLRPVDAALGEAPFRLCELQLQRGRLLDLAGPVQVEDASTSLRTGQ